jgi:hypothetical protein
MVMITQRPAVIHKNVLTQANALIALRLTSPQDRAALKAWIEGQADVEKGREVIAGLPKLQRGQGWVWAPEIDKLFVMKFPAIRTFDSSRAPDYDEEAPDVSLASVDLAEVRSEFEEAVKEAEANDPKVLRQRIATLERDLAAKPAGGASRAELAAAGQEAYQDGYQAGFAAAATGAAGAAEEMAEKLRQEAKTALGQSVSAPPSAAERRPPVARPQAPAKAPPVRQQPQRVNGSLTRPQQRVLDALAWFEAVGVPQPSKVACAFVAGYTAGSGAINNLFGQLRGAGYLDYPSGGAVALTDAGCALAQEIEAPATSAALQDMVKAQLPAPHARVLDAALESYPEPVAKPDLAERSGYTPGAGAFNNYIGRLHKLGLVDYPARGQVRAADILFI